MIGGIYVDSRKDLLVRRGERIRQRIHCPGRINRIPEILRGVVRAHLITEDIILNPPVHMGGGPGYRPGIDPVERYDLLQAFFRAAGSDPVNQLKQQDIGKIGTDRRPVLFLFHPVSEQLPDLCSPAKIRAEFIDVQLLVSREIMTLHGPAGIRRSRPGDFLLIILHKPGLFKESPALFFKAVLVRRQHAVQLPDLFRYRHPSSGLLRRFSRPPGAVLCTGFRGTEAGKEFLFRYKIPRRAAQLSCRRAGLIRTAPAVQNSRLSPVISALLHGLLPGILPGLPVCRTLPAGSG